MTIAEIYKSPCWVGGETPYTERKVWAYKYHRIKGMPAQSALVAAKKDADAQITRFPSSAQKYGYGTSGQPFKAYGENHMRWVENPEAAGLRRVGFADEVSQWIKHRGWFLDDDQFDKVRGIVFRMASRKGKSQFVAGYDDPYNEGPVCLSFDDIFDDETEAARRADSIAERYAEAEREYNEASRAGTDYAELGEEVVKLRRGILELIAEIKKLRTPDCKFPAVQKTLREALERQLETIAKTKQKRQELRDEFDVAWRGAARDSFLEAAGI